MEYHRDQIEFRVRSYVSGFIDEYSKIGQSTAPRYRNGGEYPRRRVDQDLFDQSVVNSIRSIDLPDNNQKTAVIQNEGWGL